MVNARVVTDDEINMDEAPETSSFVYKGRLVVEEWCYLPLDKRQRDGYVKPDVPYYHVAWQPLSYKIIDGGQEGDGLEHTYAAIKNGQGELTPKGSARDELVKAFGKLNFERRVASDLQKNPATGKVFSVKRYNRQYKDREGKLRNAELMNVPADLIGDSWSPPPGVEVPGYSRAFKPRTDANASIASGTTAKPINSVSFADVAAAIAGANVPFTENAVRNYVLDQPSLAQGDVLDAALEQKLLEQLIEKGLVMDNGGKVATI